MRLLPKTKTELVGFIAWLLAAITIALTTGYVFAPSGAEGVFGAGIGSAITGLVFSIREISENLTGNGHNGHNKEVKHDAAAN